MTLGTRRCPARRPRRRTGVPHRDDEHGGHPWGGCRGVERPSPSGRTRGDPAAGQNDLVNTSAITDRWHAGVTALRRAPLPSPRLSRWAWTADAVLALALAVGAVDGALSRHSGTDYGTTPTVPTSPPGVPFPPTPPVG